MIIVFYQVFGLSGNWIAGLNWNPQSISSTKKKYNKKYKVIIKTISKEMYQSQSRDGDELKKEVEEVKVFMQRK